MPVSALLSSPAALPRTAVPRLSIPPAEGRAARYEADVDGESRCLPVGWDPVPARQARRPEGE
ncbi:hypothetical protein GCM10018987_44040 [Streptomyces cremeus]